MGNNPIEVDATIGTAPPLDVPGDKFHDVQERLSRNVARIVLTKGLANTAQAGLSFPYRRQRLEFPVPSRQIATFAHLANQRADKEMFLASLCRGRGLKFPPEREAASMWNTPRDTQLLEDKMHHEPHKRLEKPVILAVVNYVIIGRWHD